MIKPFHSSKQFLNMPGCNSDASIFTQITFYDETASYDTSFKIRDCGNAIHLAVGLNEGGDRSYENSLFKLDVLIGELMEFRLAIEKAKIIRDERVKLEALEMKELRKNLKNEMDPRNDNSINERRLCAPPPDPSSGLDDI